MNAKRSTPSLPYPIPGPLPLPRAGEGTSGSNQSRRGSGERCLIDFRKLEADVENQIFHLRTVGVQPGRIVESHLRGLIRSYRLDLSVEGRPLGLIRLAGGLVDEL